MMHDIQIKNRLQSLPENMIVFGPTMLKTGFVAITFPDDQVAERLFNTLNGLMLADLIEVQNAIVVEKVKWGSLKVKRISNLAVGESQSCLLGFVVGLLLGGSVADELLGGAAGTLLFHNADLGISQAKIDRLTHCMVAGSSTLFIQNCSNLMGTFHTAFTQANGKFHDLSMNDKALQRIKIMASTLPYYWL
jgi:uncharacterized membrane protein